MIDAASGLTQVQTKDLKKALAALYQGHLTCPLKIEDLTRVGLQHCASELLAMMRRLDKNGVQAVLVAVIAERLPKNKN